MPALLDQAEQLLRAPHRAVLCRSQPCPGCDTQHPCHLSKRGNSGRTQVAADSRPRRNENLRFRLSNLRTPPVRDAEPGRTPSPVPRTPHAIDVPAFNGGGRQRRLASGFEDSIGMEPAYSALRHAHSQAFDNPGRCSPTSAGQASLASSRGPRGCDCRNACCRVRSGACWFTARHGAAGGGPVRVVPSADTHAQRSGLRPPMGSERGRCPFRCLRRARGRADDGGRPTPALARRGHAAMRGLP